VEVAKHNTATDCWLIIDKSVYDISEFVPHHPGGGPVLMGYAGYKATDVFYSHHPPAAVKKLETFKIGEIFEDIDIPIEKDFRQLRKILEQEGLFESSLLYYLFKVTATIMTAYIIPLLLVIYFKNNWSYILAALIYGFGFQQAGLLGHDFAHYQVFKSRNLNYYVGCLVISTINGLGCAWWKDRHNGHHTYPNNIDHDNDTKYIPLAAVSELQLSRLDFKNSIIRFLIFNQAIMFFIIIVVVRLNLLVESFFFSLYHKLPFEYCTCLVYYVLYGSLLSQIPTFNEKLLFIVVYEISTSYFLNAVFVLNHNGMPSFDEKKFRELDFYTQQVITARNIHSNVIVDYFTGSTTRQVEHHIFPTLPRHNLGKVEKYMLPLLEKYNLRIYKTGYFEGMFDLVKELKRISNVAKKLYY